MTCTGDLVFLADNNNVVELRNLKNTVTGDPDTGATVTITIQDRSGNVVGGQIFPFNMVYVPGSEYEALYRATLDATLEVIPGKTYKGIIDVQGSNAEVSVFYPQITVQTRRDT